MKIKDIGYIMIYALIILWLTGCSAKFDNFDPTTSTLRWIITHEKNNKYRYPKTVREMIEGQRHYVIDHSHITEKLPSVTTILSATQSEEKRESLRAWRERIGEAEATRIVDQSGARGTAMHKILEKYILEEGYLDETEVGKQAHNMAIQVIQNGLSNVTEYYGTECTLYYPGIFAGQTDLVAVQKGQDTNHRLQTNQQTKEKRMD